MNSLLKTRKLQKGQAVLVILLVMSVLFTMGLSVVSRSITDVKISQQSQESARAFWVAQAGLEQALLAQSETSDSIDGVSYTVTQATLGGGSDFVFEDIAPGDSFTYWLVNHEDSETLGTNFYSGTGLTVYWGKPGSSNLPALVATLVYKDTNGDFQTTKFAFDSDSSERGTNFSSAGGQDSLEGVAFEFKNSLDFTTALNYGNTPYFITFKMLYNDSPQPIGVQGPAIVQGSCYESEATVLTSGVTRALRECRTWPKTPEIFDYLLFSGGDIIQ